MSAARSNISPLPPSPHRGEGERAYSPRRTVRLVFAAHDAEWTLTLWRGAAGEVVHVAIEPVRNPYPARLIGPYAEACSVCALVNELLRDMPAGHLVAAVRAVTRAVHGRAPAMQVRADFAVFLPPVLAGLEAVAPPHPAPLPPRITGGEREGIAEGVK